LLNDPSVLADRLTKLESKIQQLMSGKQQQDATIQQLKSGKQQQDATIQQLQATLNQHGKFT
jgi:chromosome segregation ATPase